MIKKNFSKLIDASPIAPALALVGGAGYLV